ncbi:MAG: gamma-glutamyltransferase [Terrimesophilobacter sp.]
MTASTHWLATASGQAVLERGGNAFDAAVACAFVLQVVEPHLNGPGGDLVGIFATAAEPGVPVVLMGQGPAPANATIEHFRSEGLTLVPGAGALAAAVPGAVEAWLMLLRDHGTWELSDVLSFAIGYAREGHPLLNRVAATIARVAPLFEDHWLTSAALWMPEGIVPVAGALFTNTTLAATYQRLVDAATGTTRASRIDAARNAWSQGFVAAAIDNFALTTHRHSTGGDHSGVITADDVANFQASYENAVTLDFRGVTVAKAGAWSQGPALLQMLSILDGYEDERLDPSTARGAHTILEAEKLALADREAYYGDSVETPLAELLSTGYADTRRRLIDEHASAAFRPGAVSGHVPFVPELTVAEDLPVIESAGQRYVGQHAAGEPTVNISGETRGDTCHLDVVDRWGNMVSVTPSGGWLQSSPTVPELGFCLGTRLQMTWLTPGSPSSLQPGKRPRTTLTPTLLLKNGRAAATLGSPGGDQQDQWQLPYLLRTIVGGYSPQEAIDAPTFHTTSMPDSFWPRTWQPGGAVVEDRLGESVINDLESRGHVVTRAGDWTLGRLSTVGVEPDGQFYAAANPRGNQGYAAGR